MTQNQTNEMRDALFRENLYEILGVVSDAPVEKIKKAFRKASKKFHPDKNPAPEAKAQFQRLSLIRDILISETDRAEYDKSLKARIWQEQRNRERKQKQMQGINELKKRQEAAEVKKRRLNEEKQRQKDVERLRTETAILLEKERKTAEQDRQKRLQSGLLEVRWLTDETASSSDRRRYERESLIGLFSQYGSVENVAVIPKTNRGSAVVEFSCVEPGWQPSLDPQLCRLFTRISWIKPPHQFSSSSAQTSTSSSTMPSEAQVKRAKDMLAEEDDILQQMLNS